MKNYPINPDVIIYGILISLIVISLTSYIINTKDTFSTAIQNNCRATLTKVILHNSSWNASYGNSEVAPTIAQCSEYL